MGCRMIFEWLIVKHVLVNISIFCTLNFILVSLTLSVLECGMKIADVILTAELLSTVTTEH